MATTSVQITRAIRAIRHRAEEIGLPIYWKSDLDRDEGFLRVRRPARFAWIPHRTGTYLLIFAPATPEDIALAQTTLCYIMDMRPDALLARPHVWDGSELREVDWRELEKEITRLSQALTRNVTGGESWAR